MLTSFNKTLLPENTTSFFKIAPVRFDNSLVYIFLFFIPKNKDKNEI